MTPCYDDGCPEREDCLRWLKRPLPYPGGMKSLFPYDIPLDENCPNRVEKEKE